MHLRQKALCAIVALAVLTACASRGGHTIPLTHATAGTSAQQLGAGGLPAPSVANRFAAAQRKKLTDADIDSYIDSSVVGDDRKLARRLMNLMSSNRRGDFVYLSASGHMVTNNPKILPYVKVSYGHRSSGMTVGHVGAPIAASSAKRRASDYTSSCSPPNPPSQAKGPYVRLVSLCGFAAGWGFVTLTPGTSSFVSGDAGHLYFEIAAPRQGNMTEGGFEVYSDNSIAPYARSTAYAGNNGYISLTNGSARYFAGQRMAVFHGLTDSGTIVYTNSGLVPSNIDPEQAWVSSEKFQLQNSGWLFFDSPPDMRGQGGSDPLGNFAPCVGCSVSKVTSIAQNNTDSYTEDGSFFGLDQYYQNAIIWEQVAFGNWAQNCEPGTNLCTFLTARDPLRYYGGPQYYPNSAWSFADLKSSGYGPYESYDGIDATGTSIGFSHLRNPMGAFNEPLPPAIPPQPNWCTLDSLGYCGYYSYISANTCDAGDGSTVRYADWAQYETWDANNGETVSWNVIGVINAQCVPSYSWGPGYATDPQTAYNDPNLPGPFDGPPM